MTACAPTPGRRRLVVAGLGMVGHRLVEELVGRDGLADWEVIVCGEERRPAYDRVALSTLFSGSTEEDLELPSLPAGVELRLADPITNIDRTARCVRTRSGAALPYDALVLATGSVPFVPPVPGTDLPGCHVYRTADDVDAIKHDAEAAKVGAVIGGGLLGLEAARALHALSLEVHVVEFAPRLMPLQVDDGGASALTARVEALGVTVHTSTQVVGLEAGPDGRVALIRFADGREQAVDVVVFSAGIRPRDELARDCGLEVGARGGVMVDDTCRTGDPAIFAIGECALAAGRVWGLVGPGYEMAKVVAEQLTGGDRAFAGADLSTTLKVLGVDVASFGDAFAATPGARSVVLDDQLANIYKRLVLDGEGRVVGGVLVGDTSAYRRLLPMARGETSTPRHPEALLLPPAADAGGAGDSASHDLDPAATVCSCNSVTKAAICRAIVDGDATDVAGVKAATRAGSTCGGCLPTVAGIVESELRALGATISRDLCEHFSYSRQELYDLIRVHRITRFSDLIARHGRGRGCEICKPAVASMLATLKGGYILEGEDASLQDTNDHFLANLQRDGTYSIVPRLPGGEVTPEQLIVIGQVARDFGLYTKITGGQRIDLFGARVDELPAIWRRLIDAGMESGHAYGKALRTVKSCVGQSWCRYGVQDSTALAVRLELRYRGLRSPHKLKSAVSGCTRECAEAQSKDFGVIATERGWNLYVCGNGGTRPQHAVLLASDLDTEALIRTIDRFLMYYIRTADRLERTATWFNRLEGGIDHLRRVVLDDALGICAELEADMARHVQTYRCEWRTTIEDERLVARFRSFLNDDLPDPNIVMVPERAQHRPARPDEKPTPLEAIR